MVHVPGYTAEASIYKSNRSYAQMITAANTSLAIQPAAKSICHHLGDASWKAHDEGDFKKVQFIEFLMTAVGCFD